MNTRLLGLLLLVGCGPQASNESTSAPVSHGAEAEGAGSVSDEPEADDSTTDDPGGRELPTANGELWRRAVDPESLPALAVEGTGIRGAFDGPRLNVRFRLPEPSAPGSWMLRVDGATEVHEIHDADARPSGGAWVQAQDDGTPPLAGSIYAGAFSVDLSASIERGLLPPGAAVFVSFGDVEARITR